MGLGASLTWNNFRTKFFFFQTVFASWKARFYILARNGKNPYKRFRENPKNLMLDHFFLILRKLRFFWNILFMSFLVPYCPLNLCKKIRKILRADSEKKMLITNALTDNTEFIGSSPSVVQFKMILRQLLRFVYFSLESDSYFQFS